MTERRLTVSRAPLEAAFKRLDKLLPKKALKFAELAIRFSEGVLCVEGPGALVDMPAAGTWPGCARVSANFAKVFARALPGGDPLVLEYHEGSLFLRGATTMRFKAAWEDISAKRVDVGLDYTDLDLLRAAVRETRQTLISSGLAGAVENAEERFQRRVDAAFKELTSYSLDRAEFESAVRGLVVPAVRA
jgi:hypothetical protein